MPRLTRPRTIPSHAVPSPPEMCGGNSQPSIRTRTRSTSGRWGAAYSAGSGAPPNAWIVAWARSGARRRSRGTRAEVKRADAWNRRSAERIEPGVAKRSATGPNSPSGAPPCISFVARGRCTVERIREPCRSPLDSPPRRPAPAPLPAPRHEPHPGAQGHRHVRACRRQGRAAQALDAQPGQARRALRGRLPDHRLHPVELHPLGAPADLRADAVPGLLAGGAPALRVELPPPAAGPVHLRTPAAARGLDRVVSRDRGRDHAQPPAPQGRAAEARPDPVRRPHLQDGLRADAPAAHGERRQVHDRRGTDPRVRGPALRDPRDERGRGGDRLPGEAGDRHGDPRSPRLVPRLHGHLRLRDGGARGSARGRRRARPGVQPRLRQGRPAAHGRGRGDRPRPTRSRASTRPAPASRTGGTSGRSTRTSRRTSTSAASRRSSTSTTRRGRSTRSGTTTRRPRPSSTRTRGAARTSSTRSCATGRSSRAPRCGGRSSRTASSRAATRTSRSASS